jgi:hypothetical protein
MKIQWKIVKENLNFLATDKRKLIVYVGKPVNL